MSDSNNPDKGTEIVDTSGDDNPDFQWDYYDPDEDDDASADNVDDSGKEGGTEDEVEDQSDDGAEETSEDDTEDGSEGSEDDDSGSDDGGDDQTTKITDPEAVVDLGNGQTATVQDLIAGNMRQQDHTRKSQANAEFRKTVEASAERIEGITTAFADYITKMMPPEPDASLATTDAAKYVQQKAAHDAALAQIQGLIDLGSQAKKEVKGMSDAEKQQRLTDENSALAMKFPQTTNAKGRTAFFKAAQSAAMELGFSAAEIQGQSDHRILALAHWAARGLEADKARRKAKTKVSDKTPPVAPRKPGNTPQARQSSKNANAMQKLRKSGSIHDAVNVDFD